MQYMLSIHYCSCSMTYNQDTNTINIVTLSTCLFVDNLRGDLTVHLGQSNAISKAPHDRQIPKSILDRLPYKSIFHPPCHILESPFGYEIPSRNPSQSFRLVPCQPSLETAARRVGDVVMTGDRGEEREGEIIRKIDRFRQGDRCVWSSRLVRRNVDVLFSLRVRSLPK
jgi:hypothetical protein